MGQNGVNVRLRGSLGHLWAFIERSTPGEIKLFFPSWEIHKRTTYKTKMAGDRSHEWTRGKGLPGLTQAGLAKLLSEGFTTPEGYIVPPRPAIRQFMNKMGSEIAEAIAKPFRENARQRDHKGRWANLTAFVGDVAAENVRKLFIRFAIDGGITPGNGPWTTRWAKDFEPPWVSWGGVSELEAAYNSGGLGLRDPRHHNMNGGGDRRLIPSIQARFTADESGFTRKLKDKRTFDLNGFAAKRYRNDWSEYNGRGLQWKSRMKAGEIVPRGLYHPPGAYVFSRAKNYEGSGGRLHSAEAIKAATSPATKMGENPWT